MKQIPAFFVALLSFFNSLAQQGGVVMPGGVVVANVAPPPIHLQDVFSTPVEPKGPFALRGSPFIYDNWLLARLAFKDGRVADSILVKLNAYSKKIISGMNMEKKWKWP